MVNKRTNYGGCWPTREQEWLLRAALLQSEDGHQAWEKWKSSVDVNDLDQGSHRLLPLLYRNLHAQGIEDPLMGKFKGVYRRTWYENRLLFHSMCTVLAAFDRAGIETMILKGTALIQLHYKDHGLRPTVDFDVLVHPEQALTAVDLQRTLGWEKAGAYIEAHVLVAHGRMFRDRAGREMDLHWYVLPECCYAHADDDFWNGAVSAGLSDLSTRAPNPTDQLLHVCIHGAQWNPVPPIRWIADAMMIMRTSEQAIDWSRLIAQAERRGLILPLRETLSYLKDAFAAAIPAAILSTAQNIPVSRMERIEYEYKARSHQQRPLGALPIHWFYHLRAANKSNSRHKVLEFMQYLQYLWGVKSPWQLPAYAIFMLMRRVWTIASWYKKRLAETSRKLPRQGTVQE